MNYTIELDDIDLPPADCATLIDGIGTPEHPSRVIKKTLRSVMATITHEELEVMRNELLALNRHDLDNQMLRAKVAIDSATQSDNEVSDNIRVNTWLINQEYTRRSIPPVFRNLPHPNDDDPQQIADIFLFDLEWLSVKYPKHEPLYSRWCGVWKPTQLHGAADFISQNYPRREMHWFSKGLSTTDIQERELHFVKKFQFSKELDRLTASLEESRIKLSAAYHARDSRYKVEDHKAVIDMRCAVWFLGTLAKWQPQRTADLVLAYTGQKITRQRAATVINQVHRDLPGSAPRQPRQRRKN